MGTNRNKISEIVKKLPQLEKEQLRLAHNHGVAQYVKLPGDRFVGVHLNGVRHLEVEDTYNDWYIGSIRYPGSNGSH